MSDAMHTPGPWISEGSWVGNTDPTGRKPGVFDSICSLHDMDIVGYGDDFTFGPISKANARLIAAAPDLLASIEELVRLGASEGSFAKGSPMDRAWKSARAAIAKAKGAK